MTASIFAKSFPRVFCRKRSRLNRALGTTMRGGGGSFGTGFRLRTTLKAPSL